MNNRDCDDALVRKQITTGPVKSGRDGPVQSRSAASTRVLSRGNKKKEIDDELESLNLSIPSNWVSLAVLANSLA